MTTYNVTGLSAETTYYYRVRASNSCGTSADSGVITYATLPNASIASVSGASPLCIGSTDNYQANSVVLGGGSGAWSSSDPAIATVNATTGLVTAVASGTCDIIYTILGGCGGTPTQQQSVTVVSPVGDPSVFGDNQWNIYAYQGNNINLSGITYKGYYTESNFSFSTSDRWRVLGSPDEAIGYQGCEVTDDNHTFVYKREGFTLGTYQITVGHDDGYQLYIDGVLIGSAGGWDNRNPEVLTTFYTLNGTSKIEFRVAENGGDSRGALTFTEVCTNPTDGGSIAGAQSICYNSDPVAFTSSSVASGETGDLEYKWQYSTIDSPYDWKETGATGLNFDDNAALTVDRWYRRLARVDCKTDWTGAAESNVLKVTVTAVPSATISYSGSPFCTSEATPQPVTISGTGVYTGGTYASTSGLTINTSTGAITPITSTAGTYVVTYTIPASGGCSTVQVTTNVTITTLPVATFSYSGSPYCSNAANPSPTFSGGSSAGVFSSTAGLSFISKATGQIDLATSTPGTYLVTNTIVAAGGCAQVTATSAITITALPTATISYSGTPFCKSVATPQAVTLNGTSGGTYTALPSGLTIDSGTGDITPSSSTAGTYTVTYTVAASGGCSIVTATRVVTITALPTASISYSGSPWCSLAEVQSVSLTGTSGGTYTALPLGLTIDPSTGAITPGTSTAGTYAVTYTVSASGGCSVFTATTNVTIGDTESPKITQCLTGGTALCVKDLPAAITTIQGFRDAGGDVTDNCTAPMTVAHNDVITPGSPCEVRRTYTITDASGNKATCAQVFTITDTEAPVINSVDNLVFPPTNESCGAELTINIPTKVYENCGFVEQGAHFEYTIAGTTKTGNGSISDTFPEGTTLITWTITDLCGHVSAPKTQSVEVAFGITPISYDNGSIATGAGSGIQPMQTSTHEYFVDNKIPEADYTYTWGLYVDNNGVPGAEVDGFDITHSQQ